MNRQTHQGQRGGSKRVKIETAYDGSSPLGRSVRGLIQAKSIRQMFAQFEEERDRPYNKRHKRNRGGANTIKLEDGQRHDKPFLQLSNKRHSVSRVAE